MNLLKKIDIGFTNQEVRIIEGKISEKEQNWFG